MELKDLIERWIVSSMTDLSKIAGKQKKLRIIGFEH